MPALLQIEACGGRSGLGSCSELALNSFLKSDLESDQAHMVRWIPRASFPTSLGRDFSSFTHLTCTQHPASCLFTHSFILQVCIEHIRVPGPVLGTQEYSHLF